jgi:hypothetical protein
MLLITITLLLLKLIKSNDSSKLSQLRTYEFKPHSTDLDGYIYIGTDMLTDWCTPGTGNIFWADINGDSKKDLICQRTVSSDYIPLGEIDMLLSTTSNRLNYWKGTKPGKVLRWCYNSNEQKFGKLYFKDFNKDGRDDLFCSDINSDSVYLENLGTGFAEVAGVKFSSDGPVYFGDLDGDTYIDVCYNSLYYCGKNSQMGKATESISYSNTYCSGSWALGDFNGDGIADMLCAKPNDGSYYVYLSSVGSFKMLPINSEKARSKPNDLSSAQLYLYDAEMYKFCLDNTGKFQWADFNGDGMIDLICNNNDGSYQVLLSSGGYLLKPATSLSKGYMTYNGVKIQNWCNPLIANSAQWIDVNGDGKADLVCNYIDGTHWLWLSTGNDLVSGTGNPYGQIYLNGSPLKGWCSTSKSIIKSWIDYDGDGILDLACHYKDGTHAVLVTKLSIGSGNTEAPDFTTSSATITPISKTETTSTPTGTSTTSSTSGSNASNTGTGSNTSSNPTTGSNTSSNTNTGSNTAGGGSTPTTNTGSASGSASGPSGNNSSANTNPVNGSNTSPTTAGTSSTASPTVIAGPTYVSNTVNNINNYNDSTINNNTTSDKPQSKLDIILGVAGGAVAVIAGIVTIVLKCKKKCCFKHKPSKVPAQDRTVVGNNNNAEEKDHIKGPAQAKYV